MEMRQLEDRPSLEGEAPRRYAPRMSRAVGLGHHIPRDKTMATRGKKDIAADPEQSARFIEAARELGCDESPDAFEAAVKKVARHKPLDEMPGNEGMNVPPLSKP